MKKFTILFATLLAMSGMAFGQKEGKVLWENLVESKPLQLSSGKSINIVLVYFCHDDMIAIINHIFIQKHLERRSV